MKNGVLEKFLELLAFLIEQNEENERGYDLHGNEYWFGRLSSSEESLRKIEEMFKDKK